MRDGRIWWRCDGSPSATEHALDGVAASIEAGREAILPASVRLGRDVRHRTFSLDLSADGIAVITLVAVQDRGTWHVEQTAPAENRLSDPRSARTRRDDIGVGQSMDLRGPPAARSADGLLMFPPLPPDAHRCAFTAELSIRTCVGGPPAVASAWNMSTHTPFAAQRTKRL